MGIRELMRHFSHHIHRTSPAQVMVHDDMKSQTRAELESILARIRVVRAEVDLDVARQIRQRKGDIRHEEDNQR